MAISNPSLKGLLQQLWKTPSERLGLLRQTEPYRICYIGSDCSSEREYNDVLATFKEKAGEDSRHTLLFDNEIPFNVDLDFIGTVKQGLATVDLTAIKDSDVVMFADADYNHRFVQKLQGVVNKILSNETFPNESVKANFITRLLLEVYTLVVPLERVDEYSTPNKCIYYGSIERYAVYFLMLLAGMGFDIVYINPFEKPECLDLLGAELSVRNTRYQIGSLNDRASKGQAIHQIDSVTLGFRQEVEKTVFTDSGLFRQWQFKHGGTTESMFLNATVEDLENNWDAEARVRQGFGVVGKKVKIPTLFYEVDGVHSDDNDYCTFVGKFVGGKDTLLISGKPEELLDITISEDDVLKISFCQKGDGSFDRDMLKALPFYRYAPYNDDTEDFILDKINETLSDSTLFSRPIVEKRDKVEFVAMCLQLNKKLMYMIDTFDFPFGIPKIVAFLDNDSSLSQQTPYILGFLHKIGFDILVLAPAGLSNLSTYVDRGRYNCTRLAEMKYDVTFDKVSSPEGKKKSAKKGMLASLFSI